MDPLDEVNEAFHSAYGADRDSAAKADPVLVVLADELVLYRNGEEHRFVVTPPEFHVAKMVSHAPIALWLLLQKPLTDASRQKLAELRGFITRAPSDPMLEETLRWMDRIPFDLAEFAAKMGEPLLDAIASATRMQLTALHARTEQALALLSDDERAHLHVAVTGDHQARIRSLGMQYFTKRMGEAEGAEDRVLYAEGVEEPREAAALVGAQRLDRAMAAAFFGDPKRMQRDLLGDAAAAELAEFEVTPIS